MKTHQLVQNREGSAAFPAADEHRQQGEQAGQLLGAAADTAGRTGAGVLVLAFSPTRGLGVSPFHHWF